MASTLQIDTASWTDPGGTGVTYFGEAWQHHTGYFGDEPIHPIYFQVPFFGNNPGIEFETAEVQPVDFGLVTYRATVWDTALLGPVATIRFILQARIFDGEDSDVQLGALVFNSTTGQFFRAMVNGLSSSFELTDRLLTPAADFCLVEASSGCSAITGFGDGVLQFGYAVRVDSTNELLPFVNVEFDDLNNFLILADGPGVPEPSTWAMAGAGLMALGLARRRQQG